MDEGLKPNSADVAMKPSSAELTKPKWIWIAPVLGLTSLISSHAVCGGDTVDCYCRLLHGSYRWLINVFEAMFDISFCAAIGALLVSIFQRRRAGAWLAIFGLLAVMLSNCSAVFCPY